MQQKVRPQPPLHALSGGGGAKLSSSLLPVDHLSAAPILRIFTHLDGDRGLELRGQRPAQRLSGACAEMSRPGDCLEAR